MDYAEELSKKLLEWAGWAEQKYLALSQATRCGACVCWQDGSKTSTARTEVNSPVSSRPDRVGARVGAAVGLLLSGPGPKGSKNLEPTCCFSTALLCLRPAVIFLFIICFLPVFLGQFRTGLHPALQACRTAVFPTNFRNAVAAFRLLSTCFQHALEKLVMKDREQAVDLEELMALLAQCLDRGDRRTSRTMQTARLVQASASSCSKSSCAAPSRAPAGFEGNPFWTLSVAVDGADLEDAKRRHAAPFNAGAAAPNLRGARVFGGFRCDARHRENFICQGSEGVAGAAQVPMASGSTAESSAWTR